MTGCRRALVVDVLSAQACRGPPYDLHGTQLPGTTHLVFRWIRNLGRRRHPRPAILSQATPALPRAARSAFSALSQVASSPRRLSGRSAILIEDFAEAKVSVDLQRLLVKGSHFLILICEWCTVCPSSCVKPAHAQDAVQRAGRFVAMAGAKLAIADRQIAVAVQTVIEHLHMAWTVHRLERVGALFRLVRTCSRRSCPNAQNASTG